MIQEIEKKIKDSYYWDARVKSLECNYFGDEVKIIFEETKTKKTKSITYEGPVSGIKDALERASKDMFKDGNDEK